MGARLDLTDEERIERRRAQRRASAKRRYHEDADYRARLLARHREYLADPERAEQNRARARAWEKALTGERKEQVRDRINAQKRARRAASRERDGEEYLKAMAMGRTATRYGITRAEYQRMYEAQGGTCAICHEAETMVIFGRVANLGVDHDHACCPGKRACGKCLRGLLCSKCNTMLGGARDNPAILHAALAYLAR